jgi:hypothetical protein
MIIDRDDIITDFLARANASRASRHPLPGDASTRRYERLVFPDGKTLMLMNQVAALESPPCSPAMNRHERLKAGWNATARLAAGRIDAFVATAQHLRGLNLSAPEIIAYDAPNGLLISEDLGDDLFARLIERGQDETPLYMAAIEAQARIHDTPAPSMLSNDWPLLSYDDLALKGGADLFVAWYPNYAGVPALSEGALDEWEAIWQPLRKRAEAGACVFVHRDYHAENLLWLSERSGVARVGMIDFQDALMAHPSWDLHSLLQDARRDVSPELEATALDYYFTLRPHLDHEAFMADYTALAALNEARILGIFARLVTRDQKPKYAQFMPRMWKNLARNLTSSELLPLRAWFYANGFGPQLEG